jgi:GDP-L-fucose synthase
MHIDNRIFVAGHRGLVGSALVRYLRRHGYRNLLLRARDELDLTDGRAADAFFASERPEFVFVAAGRVGGILANSTYPAEFLRDNLLIELNIIHAAWRFGVAKLEFLGSSCIYPKFAPQPIREEYLLTGSLEATNEAYALAKIAGIKLCQAYRTQYGFRAIALMPTNLYGPHDNFDLETSHVFPALLRKIHEAHREDRREVPLWGTGTARREFLHVDDLASAAVFLMQHYDQPEIINVGTGEDVTIRELAQQMARSIGYSGRFCFDDSKPDGTPRKLLDVTRLHGLGWRHSISLDAGIRKTYEWFLEHEESARMLSPALQN